VNRRTTCTRYASGALLWAAYALLALTWLGSETARAAFPGENGRIAFTSYRDGLKSDDGLRSAEIYVMDPNGRGQTRLTCDVSPPGTPSLEYPNRLSASEPTWSPDGKRIAFAGRGIDSDSSFLAWTHVINADGSRQTLLGHGGSPLWAPDGRRIAFITTHPRAGLSAGEIGVMNADGSDWSPFPDTVGWPDPAWSPDSQRIAFGGIQVINADGGGLTRLGEQGGWGPAWSPDGERIAFSVSQPLANLYATAEIWVMNADGSDQVRLAAGHSPAWSPDGEKIAFLRTRLVDPRSGHYSSAIWLMNADGSNPTRLTTEGELPDPPLDRGARLHLWSPDGRKIAFQRDGDVWVMDADGSGQENLTNSPVQDRDRDFADLRDRRPDWQSLPPDAVVGPPPSQFCFGKLRRNVRRGTARLAVRVPRRGEVLVERRRGVRRFARIHEAKGPGRVVVQVRPRGKVKRRLDRAGERQRRVTAVVRARVKFNPVIGEPWTKGRRVWLIKR
jgi:Tol biopolymer transport system component